MRLLVLGGSSFVGRAVVEAGVARGWSVTTFNRGRGAWAHPDAERLVGDREDPASLAVLEAGEWDVAVDTWSGAPRAARDGAAVLRDRVGTYTYISSCSVYAPPPVMGLDESAATVAASPDAGSDAEDYAGQKRGAELAIAEAFGDRALLLRPGLILGPHEDVGRLPWWLLRLARGGEVLAPGPADLPLQLIDARDLAAFALDSAAASRSGAYNVVSRRGHATMRSLLEAGVEATGGRATLTWVAPEILAEQGVEAWTELPIWLPPDHEYAALHGADVEKAHAAGLRPRPAEDTVRDTWAWLSALGAPPPQRPDIPPHGLSEERERAALFAMRTASS
ncbi:MAG TPA: NAD-dependent epimerase/dehydratase family protein [Baekduia sp.]